VPLAPAGALSPLNESRNVGFLVDLHTHSSESSACASQSVEELISRAEAVGLDGVALTDHNRIEGALKAQRLTRRRRLKVFVGVEVLTEEIGDVLVYGLRQSFPDAPISFRRLAKAADKEGAVMFAAHPFRRHARNGLWVYLEETGFDWRREVLLPDLLRPLTGLEVYNGGATPQENQDAVLFSSRFRLLGMAGSDAHGLLRVGWCATEFEYAVDDERQLVQALRMGHFTVSDRHSEFDSEAERRNHIKSVSELRGQELADYMQSWIRRKQAPRTRRRPPAS